MLRRALKRSKTDGVEGRVGSDGTKTAPKKKMKVLGEKAGKTDAEKVLEQLVIGDELADQIETSIKDKKKARGQKRFAEKPQPVWIDEDEDSHCIPLEKIGRNPKLQHLKDLYAGKKEIPASKYKQALTKQFEKVTGTPNWARLRWEKEGEEKEDEEDSDDEALLRTTGNYLSTSELLPKGLIQLKHCTNANKESPAQGMLKSVEFHPSSQVILTAGLSQTLSFFQVDGKYNPKIQSIFIENFPIKKAHFTMDGQQVILGSRHKSFYYYDMMSGKMVKIPHIKGLDNERMGNFVMSPDGRFIAFLGKYGHIHLISVKSKEWISSLKMNGSVDGLAFSPDGSRMVTTGDDSEVYVWDMNTRDCVHRFYDEGCIKATTIEISKNGQYLATGSNSGVVNIYDSSYMSSSSPHPLKSVMNLTTPCTNMVFNSTSEILAISSNVLENAVKLMHLPSMTVFSNFPEKNDKIRIPCCMDFSLHSGYFTLGNNKGRALLYRVKHYGNY